MTPKQREAWDMRQRGMTNRQIAETLGISLDSVKDRLRGARNWAEADPQVAKTASEFGMADIAQLDSYWRNFPTPDGGFVSGYFKNAVAKQIDTSLSYHLLEGLSEYTPPLYAPRVNTGAKGDHLFLVDLADVHFAKLCTVEETGQSYTLEEARHRVIEGTRSLLNAATGIGVGRILFVMGNDILNTDNGKTTTSGTSQDPDGSFFQAWRAAQWASIDAIAECANVADTDLIHVMSNHDWRSGWALSQTIASHFGGHPNVRATDYNMSEIHRKYYGFERNAFMLSHGDGTKEEKIIGHFMQEAKPLVASCDHFYAILHHLHHKIAKRRGIDVFQSEKDHNGMTAMVSGTPIVQSPGTLRIEYVRSPSPPDGWHHRNGYMNRQGVECFGYHPYDGQRVRFTEWF